MTTDRMRRAAIVLAVGLGLLWLAFEYRANGDVRGPGDAAYLDANTLFDDGRFDRAAALYAEALSQRPDHLPALRGLANARIQSRRLNDALAAIERAVALEPGFGGNYAIRGIVHDHMGAHAKAISDYEKALALVPGVADGMGWLDRLLYNVQQRPPTVADRLAYLKAQMALPEDERVLLLPEIDAKQRPYER